MKLELDMFFEAIEASKLELDTNSKTTKASKTELDTYSKGIEALKLELDIYFKGIHPLLKSGQPSTRKWYQLMTAQEKVERDAAVTNEMVRQSTYQEINAAEKAGGAADLACNAADRAIDAACKAISAAKHTVEAAYVTSISVSKLDSRSHHAHRRYLKMGTWTRCPEEWMPCAQRFGGGG